MTEKKDFSFYSSDGHTILHGIAWLPEGEIRAVVQIVHGVTEYVDLYDAFARSMNEHGVAVYGHDQLGHGLSATTEGIGCYLEEGNTWRTLVNDLYVLRTAVKKVHADVPYMMLGYSMGSFLVRSYLICNPGTVQGAILVGTGWMSRVEIAAGLAACAVLGCGNGRRTGALIRKLAFGGYNRRVRPTESSFDWLSTDRAYLNRYLADPLCRRNVSVGVLREMLVGFRFNQGIERMNQMDKTTPVLFLSGDRDPVGNMGAGVRESYREFRLSGMQDCRMKLYAGMRHELLKEACVCQQVGEDLWQWMEERIG